MPIRGKVVRRIFEKAPKGDYYQGLVRKVRWGKTYEYKLIVRAPYPDNETLQKMLKEIFSSKAITANYLATKYNVKVSTVKRLLEELRKNGYLELLKSSDSSVKIYAPKK